MMEAFHDARISALDGRPHLPQSIPQWSGDSRGRWNGNTLVVDTTNFSSKSDFLGSADKLQLVERFTRVAPGTINYEVTVLDPMTWIKPWTAVIRLTQMQASISEHACHEGDRPRIGILAGGREEEKAAEAEKTRSKERDAIERGRRSGAADAKQVKVPAGQCPRPRVSCRRV